MPAPQSCVRGIGGGQDPKVWASVARATSKGSHSSPHRHRSSNYSCDSAASAQTDAVSSLRPLSIKHRASQGQTSDHGRPTLMKSPSDGPEMAQNHQKRDPVPPLGAPEGTIVQVDGQNQLGYCLGCLLAVFAPMCKHLHPPHADACRRTAFWHLQVWGFPHADAWDFDRTSRP